MIIFTDDETPFRSEKEMFMYGSIDTIPNLPDTTYFLHSDKFGSKDVLEWSPVVQNRLVIVTRKAPTLSKEAHELCVVDDKLNDKSKDDTFLLVKALVNWNDRKRVNAVFKEQPIPLITWFLKNNVDDIKMWRRVAKTQFVLPEEYVKASLIYGIEPTRKRVMWPKRKGKSKERPSLFKADDQHWEIILENSIRVANQVRTYGETPKGMKRRKVADKSWI
tara:strand:- start:2114 stop:2773 length:660 start_codon:yes stop_codon:yes gene_type:complete